MKRIALIVVLWFSLVSIAFGQSGGRVPFEPKALFYADRYGANPGDATSDTAALQRAIDACEAAGGGQVLVTRPGTYVLTTAGANPYNGTHDFCLDLGDGIAIAVSLIIGPGVVLELADNQQTDAGGAVDIIVFRDRTNLYIGGGGRITGNTAGQTGWSGGYSQVDGGCIIISYGTSGNGNHNITIEDLQLDDHFSNPVNIDNQNTTGSRIVLKRLYGFDCGEGFQVIASDTVTIFDCTYRDISDVAAGDGIEISVCTNFSIDHCKVYSNGAGSAFDLFGSKYGTLSNFVADGWPEGVAAATTGGGVVAEELVIGPGVIRNFTSNAINPPEGSVTYTSLEVSNGSGNGTPFQVTGAASLPPIKFVNCNFKGKTGSTGPLITDNRGVSIASCTFQSMGTHGLAVLAGANNKTPLVIIEGNQFLNNTQSGLSIDDAGFTGFAPTGRIANNVFAGNGSTAWHFGDAVDFAGLDVNLRYGVKSATLAANENHNYDIGFAAELRLAGHASGSTLTGLTHVDGCPQRIRIINTSANRITLSGENPGSAPSHRFTIPGGGVQEAGNTYKGLTLGQYDSATLEYDYVAVRWIVTATDSFWREDTNSITALVHGTTAQRLNIYAQGTALSNRQMLSLASAKQTLSSVSGASVTATNLIPAGAFVVGVTSRVETALGTGSGTTGYQVGDGNDADLWGSVTGTAAGTDTDSTNFTATGATGLFTSAASVVVTATGGNFNGTGAIEVCVHYLTTEAN